MAVLVAAGVLFGVGLAVKSIGASRLFWGFAGYQIGKMKGRANVR
jgi:hypothetical protein